MYRGPKLLPGPPRGKRGRAATAAAAPSFNPLTGWTTDPIHGVWASDPLWTPPADGGAVSSWRNGGSVGGDLVQATGSKQPTYRASTTAFNNKPTVQGDGTDDWIGATFGAAIASYPWYVVSIFSKGKAANASEAIWDDAPGSGGSPGYPLYTDTGGSTWRISVAAELAGGTADTGTHLAVATYNHASSSLVIDGTSVSSGTIGLVNPASGVTLCGGRGGTYNSSGHMAYWALFTTDPTAQAEWATFKSWVTSTYGITIA